MRRSPWPWIALTLTVAIVAGLAAFTFWRIETWPARTADQVAGAFQEVFDFEPQVTVDNKVVVQQSSPITELAVQERRVQVERDWENRWLLSTKRLRAEAVFLAKAGFDLERTVEVSLDREAGTLQVVFPQPEILSLEQEDLQFVDWDNGVWNRLGAEDTEAAIADLRSQAHRELSERRLLQETQAEVNSRLVPALEERTGLQVSVSFAG